MMTNATSQEWNTPGYHRIGTRWLRAEGPGIAYGAQLMQSPLEELLIWWMAVKITQSSDGES